MLYDYLYDLTRAVLLSNDAVIYESFFSALNTEGRAMEPDNFQWAVYYPFAHECFVEYFDAEPFDMIMGYIVALNIDFLAWVITTGKHTADEIENRHDGVIPSLRLPRRALEDAKAIEYEGHQNSISSIIRRIEELDDLQQRSPVSLLV